MVYSCAEFGNAIVTDEKVFLKYISFYSVKQNLPDFTRNSQSSKTLQQLSPLDSASLFYSENMHH